MSVRRRLDRRLSSPTLGHRFDDAHPMISLALAGQFATREEELELIVAAQAGDIRARNLLVTSNIRFIVREVDRLTSRGREREPNGWLGLGVEGFIEAIERFDAGRGLRLFALAKVWIRQRISQFRADNSGVIRAPLITKGATRKPSGGLIRDAERAARCKSISDKAGKDGTVAALLADRDHGDTAEREERLRLLREAIERLPEFERDIMRARCDGESDRDIAARLSCSHQCISQHRNSALVRLQEDLARHEEFRGFRIVDLSHVPVLKRGVHREWLGRKRLVHKGPRAMPI